MDKSFGENLKEARQRAGITQEVLADRLGFKGTTAISLWERIDAPVPEPKTIRKLAEAIGCGPAELLDGVVTPYDELRGATNSVATAGQRLTPEQRRLLAAWDRLPASLRRAHLALLEVQGERLQGGSGGSPRSTPAPSSAARGRGTGGTLKAVRPPTKRDR